MRIRIIQKPPLTSIDGIQLDTFEVGYRYEVGTTLGALMLAEGWAEPIAEFEPEPEPIALEEAPEPVRPIDPDNPPNLRREIYPPLLTRFDADVAADKGRGPFRRAEDRL